MVGLILFFSFLLCGCLWREGYEELLSFITFFVGIHIHGLAHAASGYHRVLEENRKLYNQVQDLKGRSPVA